MTSSPQIISAAYSMVAVLCWGTSDFTGGCASKRSDAFLVTFLAHASGFVLMTSLAIARHASIPSRANQAWAFVAGALGGTALAIFYRALASGKMGLAAPLAAILAAGIPTAFGIMTQGAPGPVPIIGFLTAGVGIWLIARPDGTTAPHDKLWLAFIAGLGFAGFFLCINQTGTSSADWSAAFSRVGSFLSVGVIVALRKGRHSLRWRDALLGICAGALDSTGTLFFIRADQTGRFDAAVVLASLYPAVTVLLARLILKEHFSRWRAIGILAGLAAVPMIALQ
jgi:drug/metabolite transporter (DMT)-like permease